LRHVVAGANRFHTTDGYRFRHAPSFGALLIGHVLGLQYAGHVRAVVPPSAPLSRAEVAWSLAHAARLSSFEVDALTAGYANLHVGPIPPRMRRVVEFGLRYVGFPYLYGGEWPSRTPPGYCCGAQIRGGFDCSGLMWWLVKRSDASYRIPIGIRPYRGWDLRERRSTAMALDTPRRHRIRYRGLRAGDLMFYAGDGHRRARFVDHVDLYLGWGWALDSSTGFAAGVAVIRVSSGWYRHHFVFGRRIVSR
jgi:hypothetical protein